MEFPNKNWIYKNPTDVGLTDKLLDDLDDFINNKPKKLKSLILIKDGSIIYEEYFNGGKSTDFFRQMSITKSINSLALGILIDRGVIDSEHDRFSKYISEYKEYGVLNEEVTIKELLQMSSGLYCKSHNVELWDGIKTKMELPSVPIIDPVLDPVKNLEKLLNLPIIEKDRGTFCYNTASSYLLVELMKRVLDIPYPEFINESLFKPMNITEYRWDWDVKHDGYLISMTTKDLAKFGLLMLKVGQWNDSRLVSKAWIEKSLIPGVVGFYGYQWWLIPETNIFYGSGHGGQALICMPDKNIIIAGNSNTKYRDSNGITPFHVFYDFIMGIEVSQFKTPSSSVGHDDSSSGNEA